MIVNTGATVDHDWRIEDDAHVVPGCRLCGGVSVGAGRLFSAGSTLIQSVRMGRNVIVATGLTVIRDVTGAARVSASPARALD